MSELSWKDLALKAFEAGDKRQAAAILGKHQRDAMGCPLMLQIYALSLEDQHTARALLELAAWDLFPADPGCHYNLAVVNQEFDLLAEAERGYAQTLRLNPTHSGALNNLSDLLRRRGRISDAWNLVQSYIDAGYPVAGLEMRFAKIADEAEYPDEAQSWFELAKAVAPDDQHVSWEAAMADLKDERFAAGWKGYEARKAIYNHEVLGLVQYELPEWEGKPLNGRSLLIHKEQGLGDMIMFASCLADLSLKKGDNVHIAVQAPLARLFACNFTEATVWMSESKADEPTAAMQYWMQAAGPIDCQISLASIARITRSIQFPKPVAYLEAVSAEVAVWRERIARIAPENEISKIKAGLVLTARRSGASGPGVADGVGKTIAAHFVSPFGSAVGISWFSLHDRQTADHLATLSELDVVDCSPWLLDMADTAALIANLDVVVAVDTAVAHLAGAMGKKVLLMLRERTDWRWGRNRTDCLWYPDVEIFRQTRDGDWHDVIGQVSARLAQLTKANEAPVAAKAKKRPERTISK